MQLRYINDAEAVIEPFYNGHQAADGTRYDVWAPYTITWDANATGTMGEGGRIRIDEGPADAPALILERACDVPIDTFDGMKFFLSLASQLSLTLKARIDGEQHTLIDGVTGENGDVELDGPLPGDRLEAIRIELTKHAPDVAVAELQWLGVVDRAAETRLESRRYNFSADWPGLLTERDTSAAPRLGLLLDEADVPTLRQRIAQPHLQPHYDALRRKAQQLMAIEPEAHIGDYTPGANRPHQRRRDKGRQTFLQGNMDVLAFVGLVEDDAAMSRRAARMALAMAHCRWWIPSIAGVVNGPRAFHAGWIVRAMPLVLDWAGHMLTPHGQEVLRDSMVRKALPIIENDFMRYESIRHMNQGPMHSVGRILMYLSLVKTYPRYETFVSIAEQDLFEMIENVIQPDGGTKEGMGYWHIVGDCLTVLYALARHRGVPWSEYVPERILRTGDFALGMRSTMGDGLSYLPWNAVGKGQQLPRIEPRIAAMFSRLSNDARWSAAYRKTLQAVDDPKPDLFHLLMAPDSVPSAEEPARPTLEAFADVGQASSVRDGDTLDAVHLHVCSGPSKGGHSQQDKGSFMIEAAGEMLAIDRGSVPYGDPAHVAMADAGWHNLLCPEDARGSALKQDRHNDGGRLTSAEQHDDAVFLVSDNKDAWPDGLFAFNERRFVSPTADLIVIDDDVTLNEAHAVSFRLNATCPIEQRDDGAWWIIGERAALCVQPLNWSPGDATVVQAGVDYQYRPVHLLRLGVGAAAWHRLVTAIQVVPVGAAAKWHVTGDADQGQLASEHCTLTLQWPARELVAQYAGDQTESWSARCVDGAWTIEVPTTSAR